MYEHNIIFLTVNPKSCSSCTLPFKSFCICKSFFQCSKYMLDWLQHINCIVFKWSKHKILSNPQSLVSSPSGWQYSLFMSDLSNRYFKSAYWFSTDYLVGFCFMLGIMAILYEGLKVFRQLLLTNENASYPVQTKWDFFISCASKTIEVHRKLSTCKIIFHVLRFDSSIVMSVIW